jgi:hypothetical protein
MTPDCSGGDPGPVLPRWPRRAAGCVARQHHAQCWWRGGRTLAESPFRRVSALLAGLADDWHENRQTCVDVLCAYVRMPMSLTRATMPRRLNAWHFAPTSKSATPLCASSPITCDRAQQRRGRISALTSATRDSTAPSSQAARSAAAVRSSPAGRSTSPGFAHGRSRRHSLLRGRHHPESHCSRTLLPSPWLNDYAIATLPGSWDHRSHVHKAQERCEGIRCR